MEPLSITASIIAVMQLSCEIINYLNDIKDIPKECKQYLIEALYIQNLLLSLRYYLEKGQSGAAWFSKIQKLKDLYSPLS